MKFKRVVILLAIFISFFSTIVFAQKDSVRLMLSLQHPERNIVHVTLQCNTQNEKEITFKMPQWTPGYYQIMNYASRVANFSANGSDGKSLGWKKTSINAWVVSVGKQKDITLEYDVVADSAFVANSFIDTTHAYLTPAATFLYVENRLQTPVSLKILSFKNWSRVATGLDSIAGKTYQYTAPDFDMLYDCPILAGNLEELPAFTVKGIPHRFIGYKLSDFDKVAFMNDLKKIVEASVAIMKDIPYQHYTFLGIGPGNGGIEHLTSSANSFTGKELNNAEGRKRILSFLAHEYFHNYNVKRVRPVELGPFNYDKGSATRQLWISEGWTVYYEYVVVQRAGIMTDNDLFKSIQRNILAYESHEGRLHQSLAQASEETWNDGPFGNDKSKTISYYDKGPVVAMMMDFAIRHYTNNSHSLDDVMRTLYNEFYKKRNSGFTEAEFRNVCKRTASNRLDEIFDYVYTTKELNYSKYFNFGGLSIKTDDRSFNIQPL